jgi:hypothetical protein
MSLDTKREQTILSPTSSKCSSNATLLLIFLLSLNVLAYLTRGFQLLRLHIIKCHHDFE